MPVYKEKNKARITKDGRCWYFVVSMPQGNGTYKSYRSKYFETKKEAEIKMGEYKANIGLKRDFEPKTIAELTNEYLDSRREKVKKQTFPKIAVCCGYIVEYIGNIKIDKLNEYYINQFRNALSKLNYSNNYKNKIIMYFKAVIRYSNGKYNYNINVHETIETFANSFKTAEKMEYWTYEQFTQFISIVKEQNLKSLYTTLFYMGMRCGEALALRWNDVSFTENTISITKTLTTKMRDENGEYLITSPKTKSSIRTLPMPTQVRDTLLSLKEYWQGYYGYEEEWFVFGGFRSLPETTIQHKKNKYCKIANVPQIKIHSFRHSCASLLINSNANPTIVALFLGHSSVSETLDTYSHFYKDRLKEVIDKLENL